MEGLSWPLTGVLPRGNAFHWVLPTELCIAWSKSLYLGFHSHVVQLSLVCDGFEGVQDSQLTPEVKTS